MDTQELVNILEASLLVAGRPMTLSQLEGLFVHQEEKPARDEIRAALKILEENYENRGITLVEVASGFRLQAKQELAPFVANLYQEKTPRYSRALVETLVLIAYRQPITRGEIEDVRGVAVSSNIIKTLLEREWIKILGHRDVPGRPAILGTTRQFLDYFNLKRIDELPTLSEIKDLDQIDPDLAKEMSLLKLEDSEEQGAAGEEELNDENAETVSESAAEADSENTEESVGEGESESVLIADDAGNSEEDIEPEPQQNVQQVDVQLDVDEADSANDETLAPEAEELAVGSEQDETEITDEELMATNDSTVRHAVGESDTVH